MKGDPGGTIQPVRTGIQEEEAMRRVDSRTWKTSEGGLCASPEVVRSGLQPARGSKATADVRSHEFRI